MNETFLGRPVRSVQHMLRDVSAVNPDIPPVIPDGIYGQNTMRSVAALQRYAGLPATGVADYATWERLRDLSREARESIQPPQPLELRVKPGAKLAQGDSNLHLYLVQAMFLALGEIFENVPQVELTGCNDASCVQALCWLQECAGLPVTGELDRSTWRCLTELYCLAAGDGTTT